MATLYYIHQVNGVKLADILFSLLSVCLSVCLCALSPVFNSVCPPTMHQNLDYYSVTALWAPSSSQSISALWLLSNYIA